MRYKVVAYGGMRGLEFPDLLIKYSTGYTIPLEVKQDEYIPLEILDPLDVKKSLIAGSLGRYVAGGKVIVEDDKLPEIDLTPIRKVKPQEANTPSVEVPKLEQPQPTQKVEKPIVSQIVSLSEVKSLEDFSRLSHYLKTRFVEECTDKTLLLHVYETTDSAQFKNKIKLRLQKL